MCQADPRCQCDNIQGVIDRIVANIAKYRWTYVSIIGKPGKPSFCYTVGLTSCGLPELLMEGEGVKEVQRVLAAVATKLADDGKAPAGDAVMQLDNPPSTVALTGPTKANYMRARIARSLYCHVGLRVRVLEVTALPTAHLDG